MNPPNPLRASQTKKKDRSDGLRANLTKETIDKLILPTEGRVEYRDAGGRASVRGLFLRVTSTGRKTWCVFRRIKGGEPVRVNIGTYPEWTPTQARAEANRILGELGKGIAPVKKQSAREKREEREAKRKHTLAALVTQYCDYLESRGRSSHKDARSIFDNHLIGANPKVANTPANEVTSDTVVDVLRAVKEGGKARTSNKLRSYLRASYEVAIAASASHEIPVAFKAFAIKTNPVAATKADTSADRADKNPLSIDELRAYWRAIEHVPGRDGAMLRLHVLTGGQRIEQLVKLRRDDATTEAITLYDSKGRPRGGDARAHVVPLTDAALQCVEALQTDSEFLFTTRDGSRPLDATTFTRVAVKHGKAIEAFSPKRVRSGVETLLAARGVDQEIRGRLQSHGVAGVQAKHYNAHDYLPEKLKALQLLESALTATDAKVVAIRA